MVPLLRAAHLGSLVLAALVGSAQAQFAQGTPSIPMTYCAKINTAQMPANESIYQSDGLCKGFCESTYALAIVNGKNCWCSDYVPDTASQVSIDQCNYACPGYQSDTCGAPGLWGYMKLNIQPSGTSGPGVSTGMTSSPSTSYQSTVTSTSITSSSSSSTTTSSTFSTSTSTSSSSPTPTPTPTPSAAETVTIDGKASTVFVTPTAAVGSPSSANVSSHHHGLSTGSAVGIAIGVIGFVVIAAGAGVFLWWRRRKQRQEEGAAAGGDPDAPSNRGSSAGMMYNQRSDMTEAGRYAAAAADARSTESDKSQRRRSHLMPIDPRLDPASAGGIYRGENISHESINTLRDDQDYSRRVFEPPQRKVLRATNPDPDDE